MISYLHEYIEQNNKLIENYFIQIDANGNEDEIFDEVVKVINTLLNES